jgi:hypothetical protein
MRQLLLGLSLLFLFTACGSSTGTIDAAGHPVDASHADAPVVIDAFHAPDASLCTTKPNLASPVMEMGMGMAAPTPMGGELLDGTYVIVAATIYTGPGGPSGADGNVITETSYNAAGTFEVMNSSAIPPFNGSGTYSTTPGTSDITITQMCPTVQVLTYTKYDASPTGFTIYDPTHAGGVSALTFAKM